MQRAQAPPLIELTLCSILASLTNNESSQRHPPSFRSAVFAGARFAARWCRGGGRDVLLSDLPFGLDWEILIAT